MITTDYYTFYPEKIKVIGIIPLQRLNYYMRSYNRKKRIYFYTLWLNSISYIFEYLSYKELFMMVKSMGLNDLPDEFILEKLKLYNINDDNHFYIYTNFKWNKQNLYKDFKSKIEVDRYKKSIINKFNRQKFSESKNQLVLNVIENNQDITKSELYKKLENQVSSKTIKKIIDNNSIELKDEKKSSIQIEQKLNELFNYKVDKIIKKLTYQMLADYCGVSLKTFKRYIKDSDYKSEIMNFNNYFKSKNNF
jgi:hypothetical protein